MKSSAIAIVGMSGRFPGANSIAQFWQNLRNGVESIRDLTDEELTSAGVSRQELSQENYVKRASILDDIAMFDASFFGFSPRDAAIMDPQHRHFLECAWEALEDAAHPPRSFDGAIGVFAGSGMNTYLIHNLLANRRLVETAGLFQLKQTGNDKDVLATRVSYQLDLRGPSINVQTACSTSLVAVHLACQSLLNFECDMALAGGVTIEVPHGQGYLYREGEILSRDGHCRSFDAASSGTVFASGLGIVVLRRLEDALEDHDAIRAVILGSAINNDGGRKVGYLAPSVDGQSEVISEALGVAGVSAGEISYVEAHGTGTTVGDPIEVRALTQAFRKSTTRTGYCAIGSLKSNVGHLDAAAGVGGLIKTVLALEHGELPPTLHFKNINPHIDLASSPFYLNSALASWDGGAGPRRAGVTALGIGGTNAHVILEEPPRPALQRKPRPFELLTVSARTKAAADQGLSNLAAHLLAHPDLNLADAAFTCQTGRHGFAHRRAMVLEDAAEARAALAAGPPKPGITGVAERASPAAALLFPGQGSQHVNMARDHYEYEPVFRAAFDECAALLRPDLGINLVDAIYPTESKRDAAAQQLNETWLTQPALFAIEFALARWWSALGIQPAAMLGHSLGEYVAACMAGVFTLQDALRLVALRGRLIYDLPAGSMVAVPLSAEDVLLSGSLSIAAINNPQTCVVSGPTEEIAALEEALAKRSVDCRRLLTSHAFHSSMMDPVLGAFEEQVRRIPLRPPSVPYLSNVTGTWIQPEEATDPGYWARHIRSTVRFADCVTELFRRTDQVLIEVGPGNVLTTHARQMGGSTAKVFASLPHPRENVSSVRNALQTVGQVWAIGAEIDWTALHPPGSVQRVTLPTYPFERQRFWMDPDRNPAMSAAQEKAEERHTEATWVYQRAWRVTASTASAVTAPSDWVIFRDALGIGDAAAEQLRVAGNRVVLIDAGTSFREQKQARYTLRPGIREDYTRLVDALLKSGQKPEKILYLWAVVEETAHTGLEEMMDRSFYGPLFLAQALAERDCAGIDLALVSNRLQQVAGEPVHHPERAVLLGPARVIAKELPSIACRAIDVGHEDHHPANSARQLIAELQAQKSESCVAYHKGERFVESLETVDLAARAERNRLRREGVYLITGGLGGLGLAVADHLARQFAARLVLVGRSVVPKEADWEAALLSPATPDADRLRIQKLMAIRASAGGLLIAQADVTSLAEMRRTVAEARAQFGTIDGVFHAAGVLDDGPLLLKTREAAERVLAPKVRGTLVLEEALQGCELDFFVLFSSISSILPPAGQVDYAAANAFLDAYAGSRRGAVTVVNWGAWLEAGMGARFASPHPWIEKRLLDTPHAAVFAGDFSMEKQWVVAEHRFKSGKALIPGTGYLELVAGAVARGPMKGPVEFQDVYFLAPLTFDGSETREIRVQLKQDAHAEHQTGGFEFSVLASGQNWTEHCTGRIAPCIRRDEARVDMQAIAARCNQRELVFDEKHRTEQEEYFDFGCHWRSLKRIRIGHTEGWAELQLDPPFAQEVSALCMHPALLDMATGCSLYLTDRYEGSGDLYFPVSYKKICLYRHLPSKIFSHIRSRKENIVHGEFERFDITICDEQGRLVAEIESFAMRRIENAARAVWETDWNQASEQRDPVDLLATTGEIGIKPADGVRLLTRILQSDSPGALVVLPERAAIPDAEKAPSPKHAAGAQGADSSIEGTLAGWFQELLGVEQAEPDDDFFALGGHSLVGIRLFAKIKNMYGMDLELATLFEARTVRQLAALIQKSAQPSGAEQKKWSYLIPIQANGSRIPMFFVHAVGGEVLFYEPLATALGNDQPVYAFRPFLAAHEDRSSATLAQMAAAYVKELRTFLPLGPYLIGGLSYGGLVALEMARELAAQGVPPALVAVMDASLPGSTRHVAAQAQAATLAGNLRRQGVAYLVRKARLKRLYWTKKIVHQAQLVMASRYRKRGAPLPANLRYAQIEAAHLSALAGHTFMPYAGDIMLLRAISRGYEGVVSLSEAEDPTLGWGGIVRGRLEIRDVPANHLNMLLEPNVREVARVLMEATSDRQAGVGAAR